MAGGISSDTRAELAASAALVVERELVTQARAVGGADAFGVVEDRCREIFPVWINPANVRAPAARIAMITNFAEKKPCGGSVSGGREM